VCVALATDQKAGGSSPSGRTSGRAQADAPLRSWQRRHAEVFQEWADRVPQVMDFDEPELALVADAPRLGFRYAFDR